MGSKIFFAGGVTDDKSGQQSSVVDVYNSVASTKLVTKIPKPFLGGVNEIELLDVSGLQVPASPANSDEIARVLIVYGRGRSITRVHSIDMSTGVLTLKCPSVPNCGGTCLMPMHNYRRQHGTQLNSVCTQMNQKAKLVLG